MHAIKNSVLMAMKFISALVRAISIYGPGITSVLIAYFLLINIEQGQDVLIQVGEYPGPFFWTFGAICIWTYFAWYSSRMVGYQKADRSDKIPPSFHRHIPRLIAFNAFLSVQIAILALPTIFDLPESTIWWFIIFHNTIYFLLSHIFTHGPTHKLAIPAALIGIAGHIVMLMWLSFSRFTQADSAHHQFTLPLVAIGLFIIQNGVLWLLIQRRDASVSSYYAKSQNDKQYLKIFGISLVPVPGVILEREKNFFSVFNYLALFAAALYVCAISYIPLADMMGPLAFVLIAFGMLVGAANIISLFSVKLNVNLFIFLLLWAVYSKTDIFKVELTPASKQNVYQSRPTLQTYFENWVKLRKESINASKEFPVYMILADGGASRSAYWVASVLSAWQDESKRYDSIGYFSNHLLSLSGASGGSVGNATFYALLKHTQIDSIIAYTRLAQDFLKTDFLTYSIGHYFGPDIIQHYVKLPLGDRAAALEEVIANASNEKLFGYFDKNLSDVIDVSGRLPILFINTTEVQKGTPGVVSSVRLSSFSERVDVLSEVDSTWNGGEGGNLRYSTAAILSARFPYISPAGRLNDKYYVDGGYFDNSGAGITHEMLQKVQQIIEIEKDPQLKALYAKLRFHLVHISNTPYEKEAPKPIHPFANELAAPVLTVLNTYSSQTSVNDQRLKQFMKYQVKNGVVMPDINLYTETDTVGYPMNWVISDFNLGRMNARLDTVRSQLKKMYPQTIFEELAQN